MTQLPLFAPTTTWQLPSMESLPDWTSARRVAVDVETKDIHLRELGIGVRRGGYITGVSFAIEDGPKHYLPIRHAGGDNLDEVQVLRYLRAQALNFTGDLVGAHLAYDMDYMLEDGIDFKKVRYWRDIQVAAPLLYELHDHFSLQAICERYGLPGKDEAELRAAAQAYSVDPKKGMWQLPGRYVGKYAESDVDQPLKISRKQEREIDEQDLWDIYNLESKVLPVLVRMRRRGVKIDTKKLEEIENWSLAEEAKALDLVKHDTGIRINVGDVWKGGALAPALEAIGVRLNVTSTGKPSIRKDVLADIDHPVAKSLAWARKVNKLRTTFAASIRKYMVNGRIHCTFNQIAREDDDTGDQKGARYGRLSCVDPNMQQQPSRDEFAKMWRSIYIPDDGGIWCSNDYSQQEPRWTTHFAALCKLPKAAEAAKAYHDDPKLDNHQFMAELTGLKRKYAKNIYLGLCYGEGGAKLARDLGLPTRWAYVSGRGRERRIEYFDDNREAIEARQKNGEGYVYETAGEEAQRVLDAFDERAPFIKQLADKAKNQASKNGFIITGGKRKLHFPQKHDGTYDWTHKALNRLIQGTSADQTKAALVELDAQGYYIQLQVHDEIDGTVQSPEEAAAQADIMRNIVPALVPFRVDTELGLSWGESMS